MQITSFSVFPSVENNYCLNGYTYTAIENVCMFTESLQDEKTVCGYSKTLVIL